MDKTAAVYHGNGGGLSEVGGIWSCTALQWMFAFKTTLVSENNVKLEFLHEYKHGANFVVNRATDLRRCVP